MCLCWFVFLLVFYNIVYDTIRNTRFTILGFITRYDSCFDNYVSESSWIQLLYYCIIVLLSLLWFPLAPKQIGRSTIYDPFLKGNLCVDIVTHRCSSIKLNAQYTWLNYRPISLNFWVKLVSTCSSRDLWTPRLTINLCSIGVLGSYELSRSPTNWYQSHDSWPWCRLSTLK